MMPHKFPAQPMRSLPPCTPVRVTTAAGCARHSSPQVPHAALPGTPHRAGLSNLEDAVRREALQRYLEGDEEQALDLLAAARAMAEPTVRMSRTGHSGGSV